MSIQKPPMGNLDRSENTKSKAPTPDALSVGKTLSLGALKSMREHTHNGIGETVLIAPNQAIQAQWRKDYPGYKVLLSRRLSQRNVSDRKPSKTGQERPNLTVGGEQ